ncbi:MAG: hypothetical protein HQK57_04220 [Deltaproteobacteria bacterium]|nr:hypothetical protein [Deltaproteobacteria bacterium]MBF0526433.1 hypothetical protein [Deltaproteobacteria bacterium]
MNTSTDMIKVDSKVAAAYNAASPEVQERIQELISLWLENKVPRTWDDLDEVEDDELVNAIRYSLQTAKPEEMMPLGDFLDDEKKRLGY